MSTKIDLFHQASGSITPGPGAWLGPYLSSFANTPRGLGIATKSDFYNFGIPSALAISVGGAGIPETTPTYGITSYVHMDGSWTVSGEALRAQVEADAGVSGGASPIGLFISAVSNSVDADVYGAWISTASSTGSTGGVSNGFMGIYNEVRDFVGSATASCNIAGMEMNVDCRSGYRVVGTGYLHGKLSGWVGTNYARISPRTDGIGGDVEGGTAVWIGGSGPGHADWAQGMAMKYGYDDAILIGVDNDLAGGTAGYYRIMDTGQNFQIRHNTAAARDFSAFQVPFAIAGSSGGQVYLGGIGGVGDARTIEVSPNAGGTQMWGGVFLLDLSTTVPAAGSKQLYYDAGTGNVKFAV